MDSVDSYVYEVPPESISDAIKEEGSDARCSVTGHQPDKNDKCCYPRQQVYEGSADPPPDCTSPIDRENCSCRIMQRLSKDQMKYNLEENGEFVARLDSIVRRKRNAIMTLQRCITVLKSFPESMKKNYLETRDSVIVPNGNGGIIRNEVVWVEKLRTMLDPLDNSESVALLNMELDRFMQMYYNPCIAALHGQGVDVSLDGESSPEYFMRHSWREHQECYYESCLIPENSWKLVGGGCSTSLGYAGDATTAVGTIPQDLQGVKDCWGENPPLVLLDKYCSPRLSERKTTESYSTCPSPSRGSNPATEGLTDPNISHDDVAILLV